MTTLRVLSGRHAGVSINWSSSRLVVGASEDLDVYIGDWNVQQIEVQCDDQGRHWARWPVAGGNDEVEGEQREGDVMVRPLRPLVPARFGTIILCIGPDDEPWPDDVQLLELCFAPQPLRVAEPALPGRRKPSWKLIMAGTATACAMVAAASTMHRRPADPGDAQAAAARASQAMPADPATRLRNLLGGQVLEGVSLENQGHRVLVRGVVATRDDADRLNRLLDALPATLPVSRRFIAAPEAIERLHESLAMPGLSIQHAGAARFEVSGRVDDLARAKAAVERVAADLAEFGLHVDAALAPRSAGLPPMSGLLVDNQGVSFLRTRDGVKHIVPGAAAASVAAGMPDASTYSTSSAPAAQENAYDAR